MLDLMFSSCHKMFYDCDLLQTSHADFYDLEFVLYPRLFEVLQDNIADQKVT